MDTVAKYNYWTFDLSPYIFQVKNINFQWLTTWWGILLTIVFFGGSFFCTHKFVQNSNARDNIFSGLIYLFIILAVLFGLNMYQINWGLRWYSTMYLIGFLSFYIACLRWIKKRSIMLTENLLMTLISFIIIGMLFGARIAYVLIYNFDYYADHPLEAIATWMGGLSFHGGVVGGCLTVFIFCYKYKIPFFHIVDKMALITPIGIGFGRIGNFINGELWGRTITQHVPWAIVFPSGGNLPRHPSQIYQSIGEGFGLFFTLFLISRFKQKEGTIASFFIIFYCIYRFIAEYFRAADAQVNYFYIDHLDWAPLNVYPGSVWWQVMTMGQILCAVFLVAGCILYILTRNNILEGSLDWVKRNNEFYKKYKVIEKK